MELNLSTFLLEIVNFLVLVWILKRFFYKPVLEVIKRRRQEIEQRVAASQQIQADAEKLRAQYENRLTDWEQEREQAHSQLAGEIEQERARRLAALDQELAQARDKQAIVNQKILEKQRHADEQQALKLGAKFASALLTQGAGPDTETKLIAIVINELQQLSDAQVADIQAQSGEQTGQIQITSAYPVSDPQQQQLGRILNQITGTQLSCEYSQDAALIAGIRISIGAWTLSLNLRDELQGFTEFHDVTH